MFFFGGEKDLSKNVMSEFLHNLSLQALTIDDDRIETQFYEIIELNRNLKALIRDDERNEIEIHENNFEEKIEVEKDKTEILKKEIEFPRENFDSFPNTSEEIIEETNRNQRIEKKLEEALNQRDEEISSNVISEKRKDLIKSMTDNVEILSQDKLNNISLIALPKIVEKKSVEENVQETIKKNNQEFGKRKKSSVTLKVTPPRRRENKKPYEKEK